VTAIGRPQPPREDPKVAAAAAAILVILACLYIWGNHLIYGDWRCAFAQCRIEAR
jgi:hypothetical protein